MRSLPLRFTVVVLLPLVVFAAVGCGGDASEPSLRVAARQAASADSPAGVLIVDLPSGDRRLVEASDVYATPIWSPDGRHLVIPTGDAESAAYRIVDHEGQPAGEHRFVPDRTVPVIQPGWSADGEVVAVGTTEIVLLDTEGEVIASAPLPALSDPLTPSSWSPDGERFAVVGRSELVVVGRDGAVESISLEGSDTLNALYMDVAPDWDGDVLTLRGRFPGSGGETFRAYEVDLSDGGSVTWHEETATERDAAIAVFRAGLTDAALDEAIEALTPDGIAPVGENLFNDGAGRWHAFSQPGSPPGPVTVAVAWGGVSGSFDIVSDEGGHIYNVDAVGIPED